MKEVKDGQEQNMGKALVEAGVFLLVLNILVAAHLWGAVSGHWQVAGEGLLMDQAWIRQGETLSVDYIDWDLCYVYFLRFLFSFFGNHQQIVVAANIVLQLLGIFLFYRGSRRLVNRISALILVAVMGIISVYDFPVNKDTSGHLTWFVWALIFWLFSFVRPIARAVRKRAANKALSKQQREEAEQRLKEDEALPEKETKAAITEGEGKEKIQFIPNPLPVPKKHMKKAMDYAFEPPKELMRYDLNNYNVNDDYDLKEL